MKELIIPSLLFGCSVFAPAFLSAFTSRDNDKGRLFDAPQGWGKCRQEPWMAGRPIPRMRETKRVTPDSLSRALLKSEITRGTSLFLSGFAERKKERKKADSRYKGNFPPEAEDK
jgi:hypothetical protein